MDQVKFVKDKYYLVHSWIAWPMEVLFIYIFLYLVKCIESNLFQYDLSFSHSQNKGIATILPTLWAPAPTKS